jgi:DNA-binding NarL/FixJ family response regulator
MHCRDNHIVPEQQTMTKPKISILIADDHKLMRMGLVSLFNVQKDMTVIGEAEDGEQAIRMASELRPDIVIMDLMMPKVNGADATAAILAENPKIGIVVLSSFSNSFDMARAISNGARGAQAKESPTEDLIAAIRTVASGGTALAPEIVKSMKGNPPPPPLTEKQMAILRSVTRGLSNQDIAIQFGISPVSVKKHLSVIFTKLGVATRAEAASIALQKHLLKF